MALLRNSIRNPCKITSCTFLRSGPCFLYQHSFILKECQKRQRCGWNCCCGLYHHLAHGWGRANPALRGTLVLRRKIIIIREKHNNIIQEDGLKVKTNITMGTLGIVLGITIFFGVVFLLLFQISKKKEMSTILATPIMLSVFQNVYLGFFSPKNSSYGFNIC